MKIAALNIKKMTFYIDCSDLGDNKLLGGLSSLIMAAYDCSVKSIICRLPENSGLQARKAARHLIEANPVIKTCSENMDNPSRNEFGYVILGRNANYILLRDVQNDHKYSVLLLAKEDNVNFASRYLYILANVLGFSTSVSFEVRLSVYELIMNIVEHGTRNDAAPWIRIDIERVKDRLSVSIVDESEGFDPTADSKINLEKLISNGRRRGLGLILTRRLTEQMQYRRESEYNKVFFEKVSQSTLNKKRSKKEESMEQLIVGEPEKLRDGAFLISLQGDMDAKGALIIECLLNNLLEQEIFNVVLDLKDVPFISSAGVGMLIAMASSLREEGGNITLANVTPKVQSVLSVLNLDDYFDTASKGTVV